MTDQILVFCMISIGFLSCSSSIQLSSKDIENIARLEQDHVRGWFKDNPKQAVLATFEEDAVFIPHHGGKPVVGIKDLEEFYWPENTDGIVHQFNHYPDTIVGNSQIAWIRGRFDLKYSWIINSDTTTTYNEGNYVIIVRKQPNHEWKIANYIFNDPVAENL